MSRFEGAVFRQRVLPAAAVAVSVLLFSIATSLVSAVMFFGSMIVQGGIQDGINPLALFLPPGLLWILIPFVLGIFAWLWLFAPVTAELRLGTVIIRSLLSAAAGLIVTLLVQVALGMQSWFVNAQFFGNSSNQAVESFFANGGDVLPMAVETAVTTAFGTLPAVVLAVVLTWSWLVRHPARQSANAIAATV
jgi:hypothetical protein